MSYIILFIIIILVLEIFLFKFLLKVRNNFQWLIVKGLDDKINYDQELFEKFKNTHFHLVWDGNPGREKGRDILNGKEIKYEIGNFGQRKCPSDGEKILKRY